jgi:hypothetical protein
MAMKINHSFVTMDYLTYFCFGSGDWSIRVRLDGKKVSELVAEFGWTTRDAGSNGFWGSAEADIPVEYLRKVRCVEYYESSYPGGCTEFKKSGLALIKRLVRPLGFGHSNSVHARINRRAQGRWCDYFAIDLRAFKDARLQARADSRKFELKGGNSVPVHFFWDDPASRKWGSRSSIQYSSRWENGAPPYSARPKVIVNGDVFYRVPLR